MQSLINPHYANAWHIRGVALTNLKRYKEAIRSFDEAIDHKSASAHCNREIALRKLE